ncbi:MAG: hypothetical protein MOB07_12995 [Acidobacteria bacterium]|nr:hypothetical protein [Acidobacteriota bacterium]
MRYILVSGLLFCLTGSTVLLMEQERGREEKIATQTANDAKPTNDQIEVKTDRFSNVTTVTLKPQLILDKPDLQLTMTIEAKLGEKTFSDWEKEEIKAIVDFESQSKGPMNYGDEELHFLIDGASVNLGRTPVRPTPYAGRSNKLKPGFKLRDNFTNSLNRRNLGYFSKSKSIEMRLGAIELRLDQAIVTNLREYANQVLTQHKIAKERKP